MSFTPINHFWKTQGALKILGMLRVFVGGLEANLITVPLNTSCFCWLTDSTHSLLFFFHLFSPSLLSWSRKKEYRRLFFNRFKYWSNQIRCSSIFWVEDFNFIVVLIYDTHFPVCITIPTEADMMMYIDSVERIIIDKFYISRISRVFILIVVYSELLSWSSQLFENVVEFCWCWTLVTNVPVLSSIACWNVPHIIYCLIGLATDCHVITTWGSTQINLSFRPYHPFEWKWIRFPTEMGRGCSYMTGHFPAQQVYGFIWKIKKSCLYLYPVKFNN